MGEATAINAPAARNRVLSVFAGLGAMSIFAALEGSTYSVVNAFGVFDGWTFVDIGRFSETLSIVAFIVASLAVLALGWWLRKQGSVVWGGIGLGLVALADVPLRVVSWIAGLRPVPPGEWDFQPTVTFLPFSTPGFVLVLLLLLGAGAQKLREKLT